MLWFRSAALKEVIGLLVVGWGEEDSSAVLEVVIALIVLGWGERDSIKFLKRG